MAERQSSQSPSFFVPQDQALIGVVIRQHGREVTRFFADEAEADTALTPSATDDALHLAGSWDDLSWDELAEGLDRIRHDTPPSPPLEV
jgi:hypothetical protein